MGNPHEFKPAGPVAKDPGGHTEPTLLDPSTAIVVGEAIGPNRNRTGVYGHSEGSVGVYGKSPDWAGFFEGDVQVSGQLSVDTGVRIKGDTKLAGNLFVAGKIEAKAFDSLAAKFFQLRDAFAALEAGIAKERATFRGVRIDAPSNRPTLSINSVNIPNSGNGNANVTGSGYKFGGPVWVLIVDMKRNAVLPIQNGSNSTGDFGKAPLLAADASGDLHFQVQFQGINGNKLAFYVTDGTPDLNDITGLLWSDQVVIPGAV